MRSRANEHGWNIAGIDTFWNKIAFQNKVFHVCENEDSFIEILAGFVGTGINADECAVVIAATSRLKKLKDKLELHGLHISSLIDEQRYIPIPAESMLSRIMVDNFPDKDLFFKSISDILSRPRNEQRQVRVYREMTSILLQQGNTGATVQLESLWTKYREKDKMSLFCAYPKLDVNVCGSLSKLGIHNCKVVSATGSASKIFYKDCPGVG